MTDPYLVAHIATGEFGVGVVVRRAPACTSAPVTLAFLDRNYDLTAREPRVTGMQQMTREQALAIAEALTKAAAQ